MIANAVFIATALFLAVSFYLMSALEFLAPYRAFLWHQYAVAILAYAAVSFINLFALAYFLHRKFFLKDTGRKLAHFDKEIHLGEGPWNADTARRMGGLR